MSFANLARQYEKKGKTTIRGGQCGGRIQVNIDDIKVERDTSSRGKGVEYAAKYREEEEKAYFDVMTNPQNQVPPVRVDVTCNEGSQMEVLEELTSIGTVPNVQELSREELTQVYQRYNFEPVEPTDHLETIHNEKEEIIRLIEQNQVCVIQGPTGCGKSTQIPQFILDEYATKQKHCSIVVTQPRRIAAITIAQRVCKERGWGEPGGIVGYQVGLDKNFTEDTRLLYCTTGVLLEKLINTKHLNDYTHIILDEVHEREEDMDFLMLIVRRFLRSNAFPHVKVVLMSATIDVSRFAEYFGSIISNRSKRIEKAPSYEIKRDSQFKVQVYFLDALSSLGNLPIINEDEPGIAKEAYDLVPMMIRAFNAIDAEDFRCKRSNELKGAVLIFLPGLHQIETLHDLLLKEDQKQKQENKNPDVLNLHLCPLHSSISRAEQEKVIAFAPKGMRKVILSTNIAESSLTIPDVKYVIDFCLTKHLVADTNTGFTSLQIAWASRTNCAQREGRVGRVQDGRVYRMVPKMFYQFKMPKESMPEMRRCPLEIVVLKSKRMIEEECPLRLLSVALDPPDLDNYEKTILKLKEIGALLTTCRGRYDPNDGDLTFMGRVMGSLPLDIHITKLILLGHMFDVLEDAIIMGCAMAVRNVFSEPFQRRLEAYNNKLLWADSSESDAVAYLNAYLVWRNLTAMGKFQRGKGSEDVWGQCYMLQIKHLKEVSLQEEDIKKRLRNLNIQVVRHENKPLWAAEEKPLILKLVLAGAFYPNYYSCSAQNPNAEIEAVKMLGGQNPYRCVYLQNMPQPAPLYFNEVKEILKKYDVSENVQLHYDSSQKLIVEFNKSTSTEAKVGGRELSRKIPGDIVMPVYRAIKMRQLNIPMTIRVYSQSEARERVNAIHSRFSTLSLKGQESDYSPVIPWDQQWVEVEISHIEDAGRFYAQMRPSAVNNLQTIHKYLNKHNLLCEVSGEIEEGMIYAAPYQDVGDSRPSYYRAKIMSKVSYGDRNPRVEVFFIDYGNSETVQASDLREIVNEEIQRELDDIPPVAVEFVLAEVSPGHWNKGGRWGKEATVFVKKILDARDTWTTQVYSLVNGVASVKLFLEDESKDGKSPPTLNQLLVQEGYARRREESYLSKRNHMKREEIARGGLSHDRVESGSLFKGVNNDLSSLPFSQGAPRVLKGPHSPLEMKLYSKIKSCVQKEVRVDWNSVNSVLLDTDPTDPHERLLVAGFVSQSSDGRKLKLNHTTVMPGIKGLAALVCLLFAPSVELRSDELRSRYIGALCGLGTDPLTGDSLSPENDMAIKFDVEFQNEDLEVVNKVRYNLNRRFSGPDSEDMPDVEISKMQHKLKKLIFKLLKTTRQSIKLEYCQYPFRWGLVNKEHLLSPVDGSSEDEALTSMSIYKLHYGIDLKPDNDIQYIQQLVTKVKKLMVNVQKDLQMKELVCDLCDIDFPYWTQLRDHVSSHHHRLLFRWLKKRAAAHGLSLDITPCPPPPEPSRAFPTQPPMTKRPYTSRK